MPTEKPAPPKETPDLQPTRVRQFFTFFKNYMSLSSLVVAASPIPVTMLGVIPTYAAHTKLLSVYTSLFCFLVLGFVFYSRHSLARRFFPNVGGGKGRRPSKAMAALPLVFIALSLVLVLAYQQLLQQSATKFTRDLAVQKWEVIFDEYFKAIRKKGSEMSLKEKKEIMGQLMEEVGLFEGGRTMQEELKHSSFENIPYGLALVALYLGFFIAAEAAFAIMALREYLQNVLGLSDEPLVMRDRSD